MPESVSVITPSYNQAAFIEDTLESVASQSFASLNHIVIDGESDDGTLDILQSYDSVDWISEPDNGQAHAINKGFKRAEGDVVGWLNADDPYVYQDVVRDVVREFERTGADVLYGHAITIDQNNVLRRAHYLPNFDSAKLQRHCYLIQPSVFFRNHVVKEQRLNKDREYSMDYEYWLDLADKYDIRRFDGVVAADRNHPQRKIIANAQESAADTTALRRERGISPGYRFKLRQRLDSIDLRVRRARALPLLRELYTSSESKFAFGLERPLLPSALRTQLVGKKKQL